MKYENQVITINSRKYDGSIHKSWNAKLLSKNDSLLTFLGKFEKKIKHQHLGVIGRGTISYEFYWLNCWYNIFRFHEPDGKLRNFYCNINLPLNFNGKVLDYVDLDIDILVWKDFSYQVLDFEEFEANAERFSYSDKLRKKVKKTQKKLLSLIENRTFPFDYKF